MAIRLTHCPRTAISGHNFSHSDPAFTVCGSTCSIVSIFGSESNLVAPSPINSFSLKITKLRRIPVILYISPSSASANSFFSPLDNSIDASGSSMPWSGFISISSNSSLYLSMRRLISFAVMWRNDANLSSLSINQST